jgi:hypothetical protein
MGTTSAQLREHCLRWYVEPVARLLFARDPEAQSLVLAVGMFWCDEANDATHILLVPSRERDPQWPRVAAAFDEEPYDVDGSARSPLTAAQGSVKGAAWADENYINIVAFGAYCHEGASQDMDSGEAHRPYAILRRGASEGEVVTEVVGRLEQPAYEDHFNVGFSRLSSDDDDYGLAPRLEELDPDLVRALYERGLAAARVEAANARVRAAVEALSLGADDGALADALSALRSATVDGDSVVSRTRSAVEEASE